MAQRHGLINLIVYKQISSIKTKKMSGCLVFDIQDKRQHEFNNI